MRSHTFFHLFTEIVQIFHTKYIFNIKNSPYWNWEMRIIGRFARLYPRRMELANILSEWFRNLGNFWVGHAAEPPLEPCGVRLGNQSVFILDLRLELSSGRLKGGLGCLILILGLFTILFYLGTFITGHLTEGGCLIGGHWRSTVGGKNVFPIG